MLEIHKPQDVAQIILSVSPCRSGSTAMLRVFSAVGVESHFQQLKNLLRWEMQGQGYAWAVPTPATKTIYLKETLGPFTVEESTLNPLEILLDAGYPRERLKVLVYGRSPQDTWSSWFHWWGGRTDLDRFILSYKTVECVRQQALALGVPVTTLVYEAFRDHAPELVIHRMLDCFDVGYRPLAVGDWNTLPEFGSSESNIVLPQEPPAFITPGIHDTVHMAEGFSYRAKAASRLHSSPESLQTMEQVGLYEIYDAWRTQCQSDLQLIISPLQTRGVTPQARLEVS